MIETTPAPADPLRLALSVHRHHPSALFGWAALVFLPLNAARLPLIESRLFAAAIALTLVGHLILTAVYGVRRHTLDVPPMRGGPLVLAGWLVLVTVLQIVAGQGVEAVVGQSAFGIMLGGLLPAVLLGPAWALAPVGFRLARGLPG